MGMRARLRASFNCGRLGTAEARVICSALKKTGMILADGGSSWYLTGATSGCRPACATCLLCCAGLLPYLCCACASAWLASLDLLCSHAAQAAQAA